MIDQLIKTKTKKPTEIMILLQEELKAYQAGLKPNRDLGGDPVTIVEEDIKHLLKYFN